jgi:uncharacterized protein (DUF169 family)
MGYLVTDIGGCQMLNKNDFAILKKFGFDDQPVGVKYFVKQPDPIKRLNQDMTFCEMLRFSQKGNSFYADSRNHTCDAGLYVLGQKDLSEQFLNGEYGSGLGLYDSPRSASRLYQHVSKIGHGLVNYVAFSPIDEIAFDPDVLVILAKTSQAEIIFRAISYKTGEMWSSKYTSAIGCSWILAYPYLTGTMNYITTGLGFGMKRRKIFPERLHLISIPYDMISGLIQTLQEMPWIPEPYKPDGLDYVKKLRVRLGLDPPAAT